MNALQSLTRRIRAPKHGTREAPTFTPVRRVAQTGPIHVPAGRHVAPAPARPRSTRPGSDDLQRTLTALRGLPDRAPAEAGNARQQDDAEARRQFEAEVRELHASLRPSPVPAPAPGLSRADQFTADMRMPKRGGLPVFRKVVGTLGFCGLDEEPLPVAVLAQAGMELWEHSLGLIADQVNAARAEIRHAVTEWGQREARVRAAADAALALGYPGSAL